MGQSQFKRLCIYFFYDPEGIVDEYVLDCLRDVLINVDKILFVSNSKLDDRSRKSVKSLGRLELVERDNTGFDVWAYKTGIDYLGWNTLATYDEVVFMNFTIVGPIYPFSEMFDEMRTRDIDFWGINVHSGENYDPWGIMPEGHIPKHLQSHFIVVRKSLLVSKHFQKYWNTMRPINSYQEAIGYHEAIFTQTFARLGFKWSSYVDTHDLENLTSYPLMFMPAEVILNRRCPVFKRKAFILDMEEYLGTTTGDTVLETMNVLQRAGFDIAAFMNHVVRTGNQYDLRMATQAVELLEQNSVAVPGHKDILRTAVVVYVDTDIKLELAREVLQSLPTQCDMIIVNGYRSKKSIIASLQSDKKVEEVYGRFPEFINQIAVQSKAYEVIGVLGFTTPRTELAPIRERNTYQYGLKCLFENEATIKQAIQLLGQKSLAGLLIPQSPFYEGQSTQWVLWNDLFDKVKRITRAMSVKVDIRNDKLPLTAENGIFWVRSKAIQDIDWKMFATLAGKYAHYESMQLFNQALPYIVQSRGYTSSYALSATAARSLLTNSTHRLFSMQYSAISPTTKKLNNIASLYLAVRGKITEKSRMVSILSQEGDNLTVQFTARHRSDHLRFDPVEGQGIICIDAHTTVNGSPRNMIAVNGVSDGNADIFITNDPQYVIEGQVEKGDVVVVRFGAVEYFSYHDFIVDEQTMKGGEYGGALRSAVVEMQATYERRIAELTAQSQGRIRNIMQKLR